MLLAFRLAYPGPGNLVACISSRGASLPASPATLADLSAMGDL